MEKVIIFDVSYHENRVAILEDDKLVEVYVERPRNQRLVGNIYRGKVDRVLPGMQSAFIDIGEGKNGFLHVSDADNVCYDFDDDEKTEKIKINSNTKIEKILKEGQEITVQVMKEALGTKGPRITTHLTLPGRSMVLLPCAGYTGISRRITDEEERNRLKKIAEKVKPRKMGLIVRTAAENIPDNKLAQEIKYLKKEWAGIKRREKKGSVPRLLYEEPDLLERIIRDNMIDDVSRLILNDGNEFKKVKRFLKKHDPELLGRVELFKEGFEVFENFGIEQEITRALHRKVWLKNGAYLVIDRTEALTVIDVNTGKFTGKKSLEDTVFKVNKEAATEIARQLRIRDVGGIIVIDFIDMEIQDHRKKVIETLEMALKRDKSKTEVFGMTKLGLVEMTRKKVRQELSTILNTKCMECNGFGKTLSPVTIARTLEKQISSYLVHTKKKKIEITISDKISKVFTGNDDENIKRLEKAYKKILIVKTSNELTESEIRIRELK